MGYVIFQSDGDLIISTKVTDGNINAQECIDFYVNGVARGFLGFNGATWGFFAL